jgi:hypothetical protein
VVVIEKSLKFINPPIIKEKRKTFNQVCWKLTFKNTTNLSITMGIIKMNISDEKDKASLSFKYIDGVIIRNQLILKKLNVDLSI